MPGVEARGERRTDKRSNTNRSPAMSVKVIVSYDGTANEDDAIALGWLFAAAGADIALAYVRHTHEPDRNRETLVQHEAEALLERGAALFDWPHGSVPARHVVTDRSTPEGLRALAAREGAHAIVFCSDSHTAKGHIAVGNSAERLLEGGSTAIAIAPAGLARTDPRLARIVAVGDGDGGARATAEAIADAAGASVEPVANEQTDLLVVDSRRDATSGRISLSSSAAHLIEIATSSVLVVPRGVTLAFAPEPAPISA
jgi:nucleotide-binding universal stress UspA family protein